MVLVASTKCSHSRHQASRYLTKKQQQQNMVVSVVTEGCSSREDSVQLGAERELGRRPDELKEAATTYCGNAGEAMEGLAEQQRRR